MEIPFWIINVMGCIGILCALVCDVFIAVLIAAWLVGMRLVNRCEPNTRVW